jgi:hypothetical protein
MVDGRQLVDQGNRECRSIAIRANPDPHIARGKMRQNIVWRHIDIATTREAGVDTPNAFGDIDVAGPIRAIAVSTMPTTTTDGTI